MQKQNQGYTLLEVIVVLALIGIFLSISIPNLRIISNFQEKNEMKTFRRDIIAAKNKAIMEGTIYVLNIERKINSYNIKISGETVKDVELVYWHIIPGNTLENRIEFSPTGVPNGGGTIRLKNKKGKITELTISPVTGKINIYETR